MGIYDREYYRREGPSFLSGFADRGLVCKWIIVINVVVFILQLVTVSRYSPNGLVTDWLILDVNKVMEGQVWRLFTFAFLHDPGSILHILFNMLFLWWFGKDMEDLYGRREFLTMYLLSCVIGGIAFTLTYLGGLTRSPYCLGASGAVTTVLVLAAFHYPNRLIYLFFLIPIPLWLLVILQVAQDSFGLLTGNDAGTAVSVHLAGAAFGYLYYKRSWRLLGTWDDFREWWGTSRPRRVRPQLRLYREAEDRPAPVATVAPPAASDLDEHLEAKLDAVLEKVAKHGQDSLTESEKAILLRASEVYRKRRT
jgi:membrane associated rhomboid family serine protease